MSAPEPAAPRADDPWADGRVRSRRYDEPVAVLGDLHGRADLLARMLDALPDDIPILVSGDVCDRGPSTREVIGLLEERGAEGVLGNHDLWLRDWADGRGFDRFALHPVMGGEATLASYEVFGRATAQIEAQSWRVPPAHRAWLAARPIVLDLEVAGTPYWLVHAGVPAAGARVAKPLAERVPWLAARQPEALLWAKNDPDDAPDVGRTVVMGHLVLPEPRDNGRVLAIDTGCGTVPGGYLTAVLLPERRFVRVG